MKRPAAACVIVMYELRAPQTTHQKKHTQKKEKIKQVVYNLFHISILLTTYINYSNNNNNGNNNNNNNNSVQ